MAGHPSPRKRSRFGLGCGIAAVVLALLAVGALAGARQVAEQRLVEVLHKEIGPAGRWQVALSLDDVPRLLLHQPVSFQVMGTNVNLTDLPKLATLTMDVEGLVYNLGSGKAEGARSVALDTVLTAEAVAEIARRETRSMKAFQDLQVTFEGQEVVLCGRTDPAQMRLPVPSEWQGLLAHLGPLAGTVRATPSVSPPATLTLNPTRVEVVPPPGLGEALAPLLTQFEPQLRSLIAADLRLDLRRVIPGITVKTATLEPAGLHLTANLDPQTWLGGARP